MLTTNHWQNNHRTAEDIIHAVGTLQTCAGLESGIEAAIHAVRKSFEEENNECLLLVDADNAFNKLNRKDSLENIKRLCPPMYTYLHNSYNTPVVLYLENGDHILSQEGVTQGTMQLWQCQLYPHDHWYKHWATKLQMLKWNRYGMQMIALQSDHWQEWKNGGIATGQWTRLSVLESFWLRFRVRRKNIESCRSRSQLSGSGPTSATDHWPMVLFST